MSIVGETATGWIISHERLSYNEFELKSELFNIQTPFVMDSEARKFADLSSTESLPSASKHKKKRKRQNTDLVETCGSKEDQIIRAFQELTKLGFALKYFDDTPLSKTDWLENNKCMRVFTAKLDPGCLLLNLSENFCESSEFEWKTLHSNVSEDLKLRSLTMVQSECAEPILISIEGQKYIIPQKSSFILGDVSQALKRLACNGNKYELILMDPPWLNKSVKRKKRYSMMETECLQILPIRDVAKPNCLISVWTTNNTDQNAFVREVLFPEWSVTYMTTWKWIKVTRKGTPITDLENAHKKPYENLVLGRFQPDSSNNGGEDLHLEDKVFVSVPSIIHSHKPPLTEILKSILRVEKPSCLELFARYLLPHWTSCGNEVLKLQHINYYNKKK